MWAAVNSFFKAVSFWRGADRIGPDIPWTYWRLFVPVLMQKLCKEKFKSFGQNASFRPGAYAVGCSKISIGDGVVIRPGSMLFADPREEGKGIVIERNVLIGSCVHIYVHNHRFDNPGISISDQGWFPSAEVLIKEGAWIGANVTLLPGITIGKNSVIGAGSVVTKSIPDYSVAFGVPAAVVRNLKDPV